MPSARAMEKVANSDEEGDEEVAKKIKMVPTVKKMRKPFVSSSYRGTCLSLCSIFGHGESFGGVAGSADVLAKCLS